MKSIDEFKSEYFIYKYDASGYGDERFNMVGREMIEVKSYCSTYDNYGQVIGCEDAACFSVDNYFTREHYKSQVFESAGGNEERIKELYGDDIIEDKTVLAHLEDDFYSMENGDFLKLLEICGIEHEESHTEVSAIEYWDGSNWKSITFGHVTCEDEIKEASDEE